MIDIAIASAAAACSLGLHLLLELKKHGPSQAALVPARIRDPKDGARSPDADDPNMEAPR